MINFNIKKIKKNIYSCYLLFGNDYFVIQKKKKQILKTAKIYNYHENYNIYIYINTDWEPIYKICQEKDLFYKKKIIILNIIDNNYININNKLYNLISFLKENILLIIHENKSILNFKNYNWFKDFYKKIIIINCKTPKKKNFYNWIIKYTKKKKLLFDINSYKNIYYNYKGNLSNLSQMLTRLKLNNKNKKISLKNINNELNNITNFTPYNWITTSLNKNTKKALNILNKLKLKKTNPILLLRIMQYYILNILEIKKNKNKFFLNKKYIKNKLNLIKISKNISLIQLHYAIKIMTKIEINIKKNKNCFTYINLKTLTLLICNELKILKIINI
ncbi:MAG: DNA polymerase III subunit delta [gamma proteobacterium endosymbiont of Trioza apicalis]